MSPLSVYQKEYADDVGILLKNLEYIGGFAFKYSLNPKGGEVSRPVVLDALPAPIPGGLD